MLGRSAGAKIIKVDNVGVGIDIGVKIVCSDSEGVEYEVVDKVGSSNDISVLTTVLNMGLLKEPILFYFIFIFIGIFEGYRNCSLNLL